MLCVAITFTLFGMMIGIGLMKLVIIIESKKEGRK